MWQVSQPSRSCEAALEVRGWRRLSSISLRPRWKFHLENPDNPSILHKNVHKQLRVWYTHTHNGSKHTASACVHSGRKQVCTHTHTHTYTHTHRLNVGPSSPQCGWSPLSSRAVLTRSTPRLPFRVCVYVCMCVCVYHLSFGECLFANTALLLPTLLIFVICSVAYLHSDGNFYIQMFLCWFIFLGWMDPGDCPQQTHDSIWHAVRRVCFFLTSDLVQSCEEWLFSSERKENILDVWQIAFKSACALFASSFALSILLISELNWLIGRCMELNLLPSGLIFSLRKMRSYRVKNYSYSKSIMLSNWVDHKSSGGIHSQTSRQKNGVHFQFFLQSMNATFSLKINCGCDLCLTSTK